MNRTQNEKISQIKFKTLVVGIDIGKETHFARAFDYRGIELAKLLKFSNTAEGFELLDRRMREHVGSKIRQKSLSALSPLDITGLHWEITSNTRTINWQ